MVHQPPLPLKYGTHLRPALVTCTPRSKVGGLTVGRMTIVERDIYGCALILVRKYGEGAEIEATKRANEFQTKGDDGGHAVWLRIKKAIQELQGEVGTRH